MAALPLGWDATLWEMPVLLIVGTKTGIQQAPGGLLAQRYRMGQTQMNVSHRFYASTYHLVSRFVIFVARGPLC